MRLWAFKSLLKSSKSIARPSTKSLGDSKFQLGSFLHFLERKGPSTDVWKRTTLHLCYNNQILLIVAYTKSLQTIYTLRKHITEKNQSTSRHGGGGRTATAIEPLGLLLTKTRLCRPYVFRNDRYPKEGPYPNYEEKSSKKMPYINDEYIMRQNMMCLFLPKSIEEFSRKKKFSKLCPLP